MPERKRSESVEIARLLQDINRTVRELPIESDIARSGLTLPQVTTIATIFDKGPVSLKDLSRELGLSHSTVSGIVDRLERRGLVRRAVDEDDRRVTRISVTEGVSAYARRSMVKAQVGRLSGALDRATPAQRQAIKEGLELLHSLLVPPR